MGLFLCSMSDLHVNKKGESLNITINKKTGKIPLYLHRIYCNYTQFIYSMNKFLSKVKKNRNQQTIICLSRVNIITLVRLVLIRFCFYREPEVINNIKSLVQNQNQK